MTKAEEIIRFVTDQESDVKFIRLAFTDADGVVKNVSIPPKRFEAAVTDGIRVSAQALADCPPETSELFLYPDCDTLATLPWRPSHGRVLRMFASLREENGAVSEYDTRAILAESEEAFGAAGLVASVAAEVEFRLFKTDSEGRATDIPFDFGTYLDVYPDDLGENVRRDICLYLQTMGIETEASYHGEKAGQNSVRLHPAAPLALADNIQTFKTAVGAVAGQNGLVADFSGSDNALYLSLDVTSADMLEEVTSARYEESPAGNIYTLLSKLLDSLSSRYGRE
ncbi:MAG: lengsin [Oscillospiraceae bacterium]|jgi:glutamine synthetase|nr:lengsin [Oscillospiraceae bacterium]